MSHLIDTCVLSEMIKPVPAPQVVGWFKATPSAALFVSVLSLGEIRRGIEKLASGRRRDRIGVWLEIELPTWFEDRVLPIDAGVADEWGRLMAQTASPLPAIDALIAATASRHHLSVVTRNVVDFVRTGVPVVNPWQAG